MNKEVYGAYIKYLILHFYKNRLSYPVLKVVASILNKNITLREYSEILKQYEHKDE